MSSPEDNNGQPQPTKSYSQKCYQRLEKLGEEMAPNARVWKKYVEDMDMSDKELVGGWNGLLQIILIFAALFLAILTAYKDLEPDPAETSAPMLQLKLIYQTLLAISTGSPANLSTSINTEPPAFSPTRSAVVVNALWFASLSLSVAVSLVAMMAKEWFRSFMSGRTGPMRRQVRLRQQRWEAIGRLGMKWVLSTLPLLTHASLLLFVIGLSVFLWNINVQVALPVIVIAGIATIFWLATVMLQFSFRAYSYGTAIITLLEEGDKTNEEMVDDWDRTLDVILIFAPLFSAVSTAFVLESFKGLKPDYSGAYVETLKLLLTMLSGPQINDSVAEDQALPTFTPTRSAGVVNIVWLSSLSLGATVSLVAIIVAEQVGSMRNQGRTRQQRWKVNEGWRVGIYELVLPLLLHTAFLIYAIGLPLYLCTANLRVALPVSIATALAWAFYVLPSISLFYPYTTVLTGLFRSYWIATLKKCHIKVPIAAVAALLAGFAHGLARVKLLYSAWRACDQQDANRQDVESASTDHWDGPVFSFRQYFENKLVVVDRWLDQMSMTDFKSADRSPVKYDRAYSLRIDGMGFQLRLWSHRVPIGNQAHAPSYGPVISSSMTLAEIESILVGHGCADLAQRLDLDSPSPFPVSHGGFADVYSANLNNGTRVAIKAIRLGQEEKHLKHAAKELHTWSKCQHPNVLPLLGLVEFQGRIGMVSPWIDHGSVLSYLRRRPDADRRQLCYGICDGLAYLHGIGIIHGDLKGGNIPISDDGTPLLTDFGNSVLNNRSLKFTTTAEKHSVSLRWTAPEVLDGLVSSSSSADVFSLGMTMLETMTGNVPYHDLRRDSAVIAAILVKKVIPVRPEAHIPSDSKRNNMLWSLLEQCWAFEPEDRPTAKRARDILSDSANLIDSAEVLATIKDADTEAVTSGR